MPELRVVATLPFAWALACGGAQTSGGPASPAPAVSQEGPAPSAASGPASSAPAASEAPSSASAPSIANVAVRIGEIPGTPDFDPHATLETLRPNLLACYRKALQANPTIRGKVSLRIHLNQSGTVLRVDAEPGGPGSDPGLVGCISDDFQQSARFPKPGGSAIVVAPLVFHFDAR